MIVVSQCPYPSPSQTPNHWLPCPWAGTYTSFSPAPLFHTMPSILHCSWPMVWPMLPGPWNSSSTVALITPTSCADFKHTHKHQDWLSWSNKIHRLSPLTCQQHLNKSSLVALGGRNTSGITSSLLVRGSILQTPKMWPRLFVGSLFSELQIVSKIKGHFLKILTGFSLFLSTQFYFSPNLFAFCKSLQSGRVNLYGYTNNHHTRLLCIRK